MGLVALEAIIRRNRNWQHQSSKKSEPEKAKDALIHVISNHCVQLYMYNEPDMLTSPRIEKAHQV